MPSDLVGCTGLADTGTPVIAMVVLAGTCVLAGLVLLAAARGRRGRRAAGLAVVLLLGAVTYGLPGARPAQAATTGCVSVPPPAGGNYLTIGQTSLDAGLAPGRTPSPITGLITNHGSAAAHVTAVTVRIESVLRADAARPGHCDAGDYTLLAATMPVDRTLRPGESAPFAGASIGFNDKSTNQDACKLARLVLGYTSS